MAIIRILINVMQQQSIRKNIIGKQSKRKSIKEQQAKEERTMQNQHHEGNRRTERQQNNGILGGRVSARRQVHIFNPQQDFQNIQVNDNNQDLLIQVQTEDNQIKKSHSQQKQSKYQAVHQNKLEAQIIQEQVLKKQTLYEKLIIYGVVWHKQFNSLFDYQEKDKNVKSTIVIEDDVKGCINFVNQQNSLAPNSQDVYLLIYKVKKNKTVTYERKTLGEINAKQLSNKKVQAQLPIQSDLNKLCEQEKQFLCSLKLISNTVSNHFSLKVFSLEQMLTQLGCLRSRHFQHRVQSIVQNVTYIQQNPSQVIPMSQPQARSSQPYFIVRTLCKNDSIQSRGMKLYPGDLIKFGKVQFKVISIDGVSVEDTDNQFDRRAIQVTPVDQQTEKDVQCKYCLGGRSQDKKDFFLHLCNCKGHIGYVHYYCLTTWTKTKALIQTAQQVKTYYLQKMKCQVCLKQFPKYFKYNQKLYHLLPIQLPKKHIMLVDVSQKHDAITAVINGDSDKTVMIGRGRNAMLRVTDITVSRDHATIQRIADNYYIKDCKSKFGTLVRSSEQQLQVSISNKKGFQINNIILTVQVITKEVQVQVQKPCKQQQMIKEQKICETQFEKHKSSKKPSSQKVNKQTLEHSLKVVQQQSRQSRQSHRNNEKQTYGNNEQVRIYNKQHQDNNKIVQQDNQQNTSSTKKSLLDSRNQQGNKIELSKQHQICSNNQDQNHNTENKLQHQIQ